MQEEGNVVVSLLLIFKFLATHLCSAVFMCLLVAHVEDYSNKQGQDQLKQEYLALDFKDWSFGR